MKQIFKRAGLLLIAAFLCLGPVSSHIETAQVSAASSSKVKNGWVKESAGWSYYSEGKKLKNRWLTVGNKKYYLGADGVRKTGWYTIKTGKKYKAYYFKSNGVMVKSKTKSIDATLVKKIDAAISSAGVKAKTSESSALKKLFTYISDKKKNAPGIAVFALFCSDCAVFGVCADRSRGSVEIRTPKRRKKILLLCEWSKNKKQVEKDHDKPLLFRK